MKVVIYARVSTQDQSTQMQLTELKGFAELRKFNVVDVYEDTKTGTNSNRPSLRKLRQDALAKKFDCVLVYKFDRVARSLKDMVMILQELNECGVSLISLKDNVDLSTAQGRLMFGIISSFAEFEASIIRERVISGLKNARARGQRLGRPNRIDQTEVVKLKASGMAPSEIAKELEASVSSIYDILSKVKSA